jgi:hypothetical protein
MDDDVSLERADAEIVAHWKRQGAPQSVVEAVLYSLRERGVAALAEPATRHRLSQLSAEQVDAAGDRLQRWQSRPWTPDEIKQLLKAWGARR